MKLKYEPAFLSSCVDTCFSIRRRFGCNDTCLIRALILCKTLRENGIEAAINFGTRKNEDAPADDWITEGHCWVTQENNPISHNFEFTFQYP